jgi:hypothetical protein
MCSWGGRRPYSGRRDRVDLSCPAFHIAVGDLDHGGIGQAFGGIEIETCLQCIGIGTVMQLVLALEAFFFFVEIQAGKIF